MYPLNLKKTAGGSVLIDVAESRYLGFHLVKVSSCLGNDFAKGTAYLGYNSVNVDKRMYLATYPVFAVLVDELNLV